MLLYRQNDSLERKTVKLKLGGNALKRPQHGTETQVTNRTVNPGRVPFDQNFRFDFPKFSYVEWNGIFHYAGPISLNSRLSTFYSTKCRRIMEKWLL